MEWLQNVALMTEKDYSGANGLNDLEAKTLIGVLDEFVGRFSEVYQPRRGTVILYAQEVIAKDQYARPSYENLGYSDGKMISYMNLPGGKAETIFFNGDRVASEAVDSLLKGQRFFYGHGNASLDGNVYRTSGSDKMYESGHLMLLNTTYGRFLAGCGDDHADDIDRTSKHGEGDFIFIAIARTLMRMFPEDKLLTRGYDWMRRMGHLENYYCDKVAESIDGIFDDKRAKVLMKFREYYAEAKSVGATPVPFYREPEKVTLPETAPGWSAEGLG